MSVGMALAPAMTLNRMYHWAPRAMRRIPPMLRLSPTATKATVANGKRKFAGKLARTWTTGCAYRARRGLMPILTPIGTQTSDAKTTRVATRSRV